MSVYERFDGRTAADRQRCFVRSKLRNKSTSQTINQSTYLPHNQSIDQSNNHSSNQSKAPFNSGSDRWLIDVNHREKYQWNNQQTPVNLSRPLSSKTSHSINQSINQPINQPVSEPLAFHSRSERFVHTKRGPGPCDIVPHSSAFNQSINQPIKQSLNVRRVQTAPSIPSTLSTNQSTSQSIDQPVNPHYDWPRPSSMYGSFAHAPRDKQPINQSINWPSAVTYDPLIDSVKPSINQSSGVAFQSLVERKVHEDKTWVPASWDYSADQSISQSINQSIGHSIKGTIGQANVQADRLSFNPINTPGPGNYSFSQSINQSFDSRHVDGPAYTFTGRLPSMFTIISQAINQPINQSASQSISHQNVSRSIGETHSKHYNSTGGWV